ncbi:MAG TPA: hypothetical protein PL051_01255 [Candidatus Saccharibacteria bacterium]|nr:hypothetical protein [Candidatus Saccharibacteria bacterium]
MKTILTDYDLSQCRPQGLVINTQFTEEVMNRIASLEIKTQLVRTRSVNKTKETFFMKLRKLPLTVMILLVLALGITLSATSYAMYEIFFKPEVTQKSVGTTIDGRTELAFDVTACGDTKGNTKYELKRNSTISANQAKQVLQAQCELNLINEWFDTVTPEKYKPMYGTTDRAKYKAGQTYTSYNATPSFALEISSIKNGKIRTNGDKKYGIPDTTLDTSKLTKYVIDGRIQDTSSSLKAGDAITALTLEEYTGKLESDCQGWECNIDGHPTKTIVSYVVKLALPYKAYDPLAAQSLTELLPCDNNPQDICKFNGGIPVYMGDAFTNHTNAGPEDYYRIQGKLVRYDPSSFVLKGSSGKLYTFRTAFDRITDFNVNKSADYDNTVIKVGDSLSVSYYAASPELATAVDDTDINEILLDLELVSKGDPIKKY